MRLPFLSHVGVPRIAGRITALQPGDRLIATILLGLVVLVSIAATLHFVRTFQIIVPAYGGTLTEGVVGSPRFPNPVLAVSDVDQDIVALTYAGLMGYDRKGAFVPVLAQSVERSGDGTSYTFVLRENARFSDDTPVTADDVAFTIGLVQDPAVKSPHAAQWTGVRVEVVDARTIRFTLPQAYAGFIAETTLGILPRHVWEEVDPADLPFSIHTLEPVGAGPFALDRITRSGDGSLARYRLTASDDYVLGRPYLDTLELSFYDDQASLRSALAGGDIDAAYGATGERTLTAPYARIFGVFFNGSDYAPLQDKAVRTALSEAIDRETLVRDVFSGYATPLTGPLPPGIGGTPSIGTGSPTQTLTSAGWKQDPESGLWGKGGVELSLTLVTSSAPELRAVADAIAEQWELIGIPVETVLYAPGELAQQAIRPRSYQALLFGEVVTSHADLYSFWASSQRTGTGLNVSQFANPSTDRLLAELRSGTSENPLEATARVAADITDAVPAAFLYTPSFLYALSPDISGVVLGAIEHPSDRYRSVAGWYRYQEYVWPLFVDEHKI